MTKRRVLLSTTVATLGICLAILANVSGQDKKGPNVQQAPKGAKDNQKTKYLHDLELAYKLIQFGRDNKHAESLLIAAQILHQTPTEALKVEHKIEGEAKKSKEGKKVDNSPAGLIAEAKKMSSAPHVASLAAATQKIIEEEPRGRVGGPGLDKFSISAGQTVNWNAINFVGGQRAEVAVATDLKGSLILEVRDQSGNLIARDTAFDNLFQVYWYPAFTGPFFVRLINTDNIFFNCALATN